MNFSMSEDEYTGFSGLESSGDMSMGMGVSGLTQRPAEEEQDPYNFEINVKGSASASSAPWMTKEDRDKKKGKKKSIKAGDRSSLNKANKYLKKYKGGARTSSTLSRQTKKVETLDDLSLSEDSDDSDFPRQRQKMQFKVPTASQESSAGGLRRSSALTSLGSVAKPAVQTLGRNNNFDMSDDDDGDELVNSFSNTKVSPTSKKLPGGLAAFMEGSAEKKKLPLPTASISPKIGGRNEALGNVKGFDEVFSSTTTNEALGNVRGFDDLVVEDKAVEEIVENRRAEEETSTRRSEALGNIRGFDEVFSSTSKSEAFGNIRGFEELEAEGTVEALEEESMGEEILEESNVGDSMNSFSNNLNSSAARRRNPSPPVDRQNSAATEYSMDDFEKDEYSMDDFETSIQASNRQEKRRIDIAASSTNNSENRQNRSNSQAKRGPSPRAKSAVLRRSPSNPRSVGAQPITREIGCQAERGVEIGIQAEMVPLPPLGMDPYMYHLGFGRPGGNHSMGPGYGRTPYPHQTASYGHFRYGMAPPAPQSSYVGSLSSAMQGIFTQPSASPTATGRTEEAREPAGDPDIDSDLPKASSATSAPPPLPTAHMAGIEIRKQITASNQSFHRQLALIRDQIDKSRARAAQAHQAMNFHSYQTLQTKLRQHQR